MSDAIPESNQIPVLNTSAGLLSTGGDSELLEELVLIFIDMVPAQLATMKEAAAAGDGATAAREAHSLKGAAAALGVNGIGKLAEDIEASAHRGSLRDVSPLVISIEELVSRLKREFAPD